ncbi:ArnT family glycosyltransferase [Glycocaulis sp.]
MGKAFQTLISPGRAWILVVAVSMAAGLAGMFTLPVMDRDEARFAQATAQMLETQDFVRIAFLDEDRNKKPVGIHWLQSVTVGAAQMVTGALENRQIWAWRIPSLLGAVLTALATFLIANRLLVHPAGLIAGTLMGATVLLGAESGIAKTDAMLAGITTFALYALIRLKSANTLSEQRKWAIALWALMALGGLIKGPVTPLAVGLAAITLSLWERKGNWLKPLAFWPGPLLAALILIPWLVSVQIATDGAFLREALGEDLGPKVVTGHESHGGLPGYHLLLLSALFFPAILFLPAGIAAAWRALKEKSDAAMAARWLIVMSLPFWLVFEILPTKLPHYVLPAYPALAVLSAWGVLEWGKTGRIFTYSGAGFAVFGGAIIGAVLVYIAAAHEGPLGLAIFMSILIFAALLAALILALRGRVVPALIPLIAAGLIWQGAGRGMIAPATDLFPSRDAAQLIHEAGLMGPDTELLSSYTEPSLAFALRSDIALIDIDEIRERAGALTTRQLLIIDLSRTGEADAGFLARVRARACDIYETSGYNYSRGRATALLIARTGPCEE